MNQLQITLILNENEKGDSFPTFSQSQNHILASQSGLIDLAIDMGIQRENNNSQRDLVSILIPFNSVQTFLKEISLYLSQHQRVDFILLPSAAKAFEVSDFIQEQKELEEDWPLLFINHLIYENRIFTIGFEAWGLPDLIATYQDETSIEFIESASIYHQATPLQDKEKMDSNNGIYKLIKEKRVPQKLDLENPFGYLRFVKQI